MAVDWNPLPDTGQSQCYDTEGVVIDCETLPGQDAQYHGQQPNYRNNNDGTVTDLNTKLMWMRETADTNNDTVIDLEDELRWQEGIDYCASLIFATHGDWRLPARFELQSVIDYGQQFGPKINPIFSSWEARYWSSSPCENENGPWFVSFQTGVAYCFNETVDYFTT